MELRKLVVRLVMMTDLSKHFESIAALNGSAEGSLRPVAYAGAEGRGGAEGGAPGGGADAGASTAPDVTLALTVAIKGADLGHSIKPWDLHLKVRASTSTATAIPTSSSPHLPSRLTLPRSSHLQPHLTPPTSSAPLTSSPLPSLPNPSGHFGSRTSSSRWATKRGRRASRSRRFATAIRTPTWPRAKVGTHEAIGHMKTCTRVPSAIPFCTIPFCRCLPPFPSTIPFPPLPFTPSPSPSRPLSRLSLLCVPPILRGRPACPSRRALRRRLGADRRQPRAVERIRQWSARRQIERKGIPERGPGRVRLHWGWGLGGGERR